MSHAASALASSRSWTRDGFLISTDTSLIPLAAVNAAFASPEVYWAKALPEPVLREMLDNSLCFGLYSPTPSLPPPTDTADLETTTTETDPAETLHEIALHAKQQRQRRPDQEDDKKAEGKGEEDDDDDEEAPSLIGFARAITDRTTFFYLTDVYVLPAWQGQGLGDWLVSCVQEVAEAMPFLRRTMCVTTTTTTNTDGSAGQQQSRSEKFYERLMHMERVGGPIVALSWKGPGNVI